MGGVNFIQKKLSKFYLKKFIHKNKLRKIFYPEVLSQNFFIQNLRDLFDDTLYTKSNHPNKLLIG